ncbi:uncharacterized protein LOC113294179 [Papaver somniferum]|uniref:uncharacterized protein LOC113294179 n=1 Tax=Papaver somniferum TaxID=3469 RepID=UPI000E6F8F59|nr:uncharacterized protein LOC113294179 [Papaver somniferum]
MGNLNHLPTDILLDKITRLPAESIQDCKSWRDLVSHHPSFSRLYLTHLNHFADSGKLSFLVLAENNLHYFENNESRDEMPIQSIRRFNLISPFRNFYSYKVLGTINGLVCLYIQGQLDVIEVVVYTLGSGEGWRNVGRFDSEYINTDGVFANGALHWVDVKGRRVLAFDLTEEKFREHITLPRLPPGQRSFHRYALRELGGVMYFFRATEDLYSEIRLLKEKNDDVDMKEKVEHKPLGWRKGFRLPVGRKPLAFTKSDGVLCYDFWSLDISEPIASTSKELVDWILFDDIFFHKNTLVSLKELGEEEIKTMEPAEIEETERCDFSRRSY